MLDVDQHDWHIFTFVHDVLHCWSHHRTLIHSFHAASALSRPAYYSYQRFPFLWTPWPSIKFTRSIVCLPLCGSASIRMSICNTSTSRQALYVQHYHPDDTFALLYCHEIVVRRQNDAAHEIDSQDFWAMLVASTHLFPSCKCLSTIK